MVEARAAAAEGDCDELATLSGQIYQLDPTFHVEVFRVDATVNSCTRIRDGKLARADAPDPSTLPSPDTAAALSWGVTLAGIGVLVAGLQVRNTGAAVGLLGTGLVLTAVGPWTGRRYGNAATSPWRNPRLVGLGVAAVGMIGAVTCAGEGNDTACAVGAGTVALGGLVFAVSTLFELANTGADVRKAQAIQLTPTVGPVPGGGTLGLSGRF